MTLRADEQESLRALLHRALAASEETKQQIDCLSADFKKLRGDVNQLVLENASRASYFAGIKTGSMGALLALAALAGGSTAKLVDWLSGK